jgi:hypothetical protein
MSLMAQWVVVDNIHKTQQLHKRKRDRAAVEGLPLKKENILALLLFARL